MGVMCVRRAVSFFGFFDIVQKICDKSSINCLRSGNPLRKFQTRSRLYLHTSAGGLCRLSTKPKTPGEGSPRLRARAARRGRRGESAGLTIHC